MKPIAKLTLLLLAITTSVVAQSQSEMNQEAARHFATADKELNQVYQQVLATLDPAGAKLLKEAQRAWIVYRDAEAAFAADDARGGSMAPLLLYGSQAILTEERVKHLKERLGEETPPAKPVRRADPVTEPEPAPVPHSYPATAKEQGAKTQHQAAQAFFEAYKNHNRNAALLVATQKVIDKLVWSLDAGDNPTLKLMDDTHIYYEGGSIELKMQKTKDGRWIVGDVGMTAD